MLPDVAINTGGFTLLPDVAINTGGFTLLPDVVINTGGFTLLPDVVINTDCSVFEIDVDDNKTSVASMLFFITKSLN